MRLYHVTPRPRSASIVRHGLLPSMSEGAEQRVWLVRADLIGWAFGHVAESKGLKPKDLVLFSVHVPDEQLAEVRPGVYVCRSPCKLVARIT